ncbi:MAG TPA: hypothetical protein VF824_05080 [Thermoanaerobaculia bacterium]|jgi:hypothetical protein
MRKELAELRASRAFWLLLIAIGLLEGQSFITAVRAYAEASGIGGGPAALAQGLSPLDGIVVPSFGAYDLAITLLFPFVVIRLIASEKATGALQLMVQWPASLARQMFVKAITLLLAWLVSLIPLLLALVLWRIYGGHLDFSETANVFLGYTLRFLFTASLAALAAAAMPGAANAAIVVLAFTIATWALDFVAAGRGGWIERVAAFTPAAILRSFEQGLLRADVVLVALIVTLALFACATIALDAARARVVRTSIVIVIALVIIAGAMQLRASADLSENRRNSFAPADEQRLASIAAPLRVTVFLAAEDPRMRDFASNVLIKLRRSMRALDVRYPLAGRSGLFENDQRYGEIVYDLGGKRSISRSTTEEIVLDTIYSLAGLVRGESAPSDYPGYPLAKTPRGAELVFYLLWPALVAAAYLLSSRA